MKIYVLVLAGGDYRGNVRVCFSNFGRTFNLHHDDLKNCVLKAKYIESNKRCQFLAKKHYKLLSENYVLKNDL